MYTLNLSVYLVYIHSLNRNFILENFDYGQADLPRCYFTMQFRRDA